MRKLKNVVIINDFDYVQGGASKVAIQTANLLAELNKTLNVYYFSAVHSDESVLSENVVNVCIRQKEALREKNKIKGIFNGIYNFKAKRELKKLLKTLNQDETIIHIHGWTKALSCSIFDICFKMNYRVVLTMHDYFTACPNGGYFNYKKNEICHLKPLSWNCIKCNCDSRNYLFKIYRVVRQFVQNKIVKINDRLTDVISISEFSEKILKETLGENVKIHRVYNPIDLDNNFQKVNYRKKDYFLYVGRVSKEKGVDIFCKAITQTNKKGIVVGDGPELRNLKERYQNIEFVGWKNSDEVKKYMQGAKALIFPSRCYETMGLSVVEMQLYKKPIIANQDTAASEFIENGKNGFLYKNINELNNLINKIDVLDLDNFKYDFSRYAREYYLKHLIDIYDRKG